MRIGLVASAAAAAAVGVVALVLNQAPQADEADEVASAMSAMSATSAAPAAGGSCPLSQAKQVKAVEAWDKMMPVFRHPRCINCHGATPFPLVQPGEPPKQHMNVVEIDSSDKPDICQDCHVEGWKHTQQEALDFTKKTDIEICKLQKNFFQAAEFVKHIENDHLIRVAFEGTRGLELDGQGIDLYETKHKKTFVPEPPPATHAMFVQMARDWVEAQGGSFVGDLSCGCEIVETGEVYLLAVQHDDDRAIAGFVVTDSVTMKIRVEDTTVTVYAIKNFVPSAVPSHITSGLTTVKWVMDQIGHMNVATAVGHIAIDFPEAGTRVLRVEFTHKDPVSPVYETIWSGPVPASWRGGGGPGGHQRGATFELVDGKTSYEVKGYGVVTRLTQLSSARK